MKRGKKPAADPSLEWKISIKQSIAGRLELLLADPVTGKIGHGKRSRLINALLSEYLNKISK